MSYRTSGEFGESKKTGSIGAGGGIGGQKGADFSGGKDVDKAVKGLAAAQKFNIPDVPKQEGIMGTLQNIAFNPISSFLTGSIPGMFASLAFGKGPYTQESLTSGNFADLTTAPTNYRQAVLDAMGGTYSEQQANQIAAGDAAKFAEQQATKGPQNLLANTPTTMEQINPFQGDTDKMQRYQDFMIAGYPADMAEYLVNQLV